MRCGIIFEKFEVYEEHNHIDKRLWRYLSFGGGIKR